MDFCGEHNKTIFAKLLQWKYAPIRNKTIFLILSDKKEFIKGDIVKKAKLQALIH